MAFGLLAEAVAEFAKRPLVQKALIKPSSPEAVLSFFTGLDCYSKKDAEKLRIGSYIQEMSQFWYSGGPLYDELCQPFKPVIQNITKEYFRVDPIWQSSVDGKVSQLILADQLARNIFRGSDEAFAYDHIALDTARFLVQSQNLKEEKMSTEPLIGEFFPSYWTFVATSLMHSECIEDHDTSLRVLDHAKNLCADQLQWWEDQTRFELDHKKVIEQFGRYPHRNKIHGRLSTAEEETWLADLDNLPLWAKSQM